LIGLGIQSGRKAIEIRRRENEQIKLNLEKNNSKEVSE